METLHTKNPHHHVASHHLQKIKSNKHIMKKSLTTFRIHTITKFGVGFFEKKALSIEDCFLRISKADKQKATSIECLESDCIRFIEKGLLLEQDIISLTF